MEETAKTILDQVSDPISITEVLSKYPVKYEESMNTVLAQEVTRYNKLLTTVKQTLLVSPVISLSDITLSYKFSRRQTFVKFANFGRVCEVESWRNI